MQSSQIAELGAVPAGPSAALTNHPKQPGFATRPVVLAACDVNASLDHILGRVPAQNRPLLRRLSVGLRSHEHQTVWGRHTSLESRQSATSPHQCGTAHDTAAARDSYREEKCTKALLSRDLPCFIMRLRHSGGQSRPAPSPGRRHTRPSAAGGAVLTEIGGRLALPAATLGDRIASL